MNENSRIRVDKFQFFSLKFSGVEITCSYEFFILCIFIVATVYLEKQSVNQRYVETRA